MSTEEEDKVVVSDLLCYLQCKMESVPKESLVQVVSNFYKLEAIVAARELLYKDLPSSLPRVVRHVSKKDNVSVMYDVMQKILAESKIMFVCKDLNNVPPLSLKNVDPVMLLRQSADMQDEMSELKKDNRAMKLELAEIKKFMSDIRESICPTPLKNPLITYSSTLKTPKGRSGNHFPLDTSQAIVDLLSGARDNVDQTSSKDEGSSRQDTTRGKPSTELANLEASRPGNHNPPLGAGSNQFYKDKDGFLHRIPRQRKQPVIGRGNSSKLRVMTVRKRKHLFVSRLHEETTSQEINDFVMSVTDGSTVEVEKLKSKHSGYASFKISCDEKYSEVLLNENTWDDGILIRPYFIARKSAGLNNIDSIQENGGQK